MFKTARRQRKLRKDSRTNRVRANALRGGGGDAGDNIDIRGYGRDIDKYFRCWNCGFVCNVERDELGDGDSVHGIGYEIYEQKYSTDPYPDAQGEYVHGDPTQIALINTPQLGNGHIVLENGMDGEPKVIMQNWGPVVNTGCPFCGCRNWRGDY